MEPLLEPFRADDRGRRSGPLQRGGYRVWQASRESVAKYRDRVADRSAIEWTEATWNPGHRVLECPRPGSRSLLVGQEPALPRTGETSSRASVAAGAVVVAAGENGARLTLAVDIPGSEALRLDFLLLDVNGTLTDQACLIEGVQERLGRLSEALE